MVRRTTVSATDLRVRLGEMLRRLDEEDLVIEKGGTPVAILSRYRPAGADGRGIGTGVSQEYERSLVKTADARGWETTLDAIRAGWKDVDADAMLRRIYEARDENARRARHYTLDIESEEDAASEARDDAWTTAPARLRRLHRPAPTEKRVADGGDASYDVGSSGDHDDHLRRGV